METIFAQATPRGKSGIAVIRISGPLASQVITKLVGDIPQPRKTSLRFLKDRQGLIIDQAVVLFFKAPNSFTGEDVVEFQLHGSIAVLNAVTAELNSMKGLRVAEPGEFTRRALENNRLDLAQIEGLADLIESETEAQRRQAMRVFSGALGQKANDWRRSAIRAAALLEATIDFVDEEVPEDVSGEVQNLITSLLNTLEAESSGSRIAERIRDGFEVAIVGPPNVGKSTLLNALAGREAAITSETAGTTRDVIEVRMDLRGLPVTLLDTAGLRETDDSVEKIGVARAVERAKHADLRIFLHEGARIEGVDAEPGDIIVRGKGDLVDAPGSVSGLTGKGVSELVDRVADILEQRASASQTAIRARHRYAIDRAISALTRASKMVESGSEYSEIAAEELRTAVRALDSLIGRVDVEDLLDEIFSSFCLGK